MINFDNEKQKKRWVSLQKQLGNKYLSADVTEKANAILRILESAEPPFTLKSNKQKEQSIFDYYQEHYES